MADLRDERGNPIQLTDEHGNPVQLTDEFGNPMHLTGVATSTVGGTTTTGVTHGTTPAVGGVTHETTPTAGVGYGGTGATHATPTDYAKQGAHAVAGAGGATLGAAAGVGGAALGAVTGAGKAAGDVMTGHAPGSRTHPEHQLERSSSSSSSEEDDGQGGRRKKKGLKEKIKEKLTGGKHKEKDKDKDAHAHSFTTTISSTTAPGHPHDPEKIRVEHHEQEKKGMLDRIKDKLPGHN